MTIKVFHVWQCSGANMGMLVKKCFVTDGNGEDHAVVDFDGFDFYLYWKFFRVYGLAAISYTFLKNLFIHRLSINYANVFICLH